MGALQAATFLAACHNIILCGFWICFHYKCFSTVSGEGSCYWSGYFAEDAVQVCGLLVCYKLTFTALSASGPTVFTIKFKIKGICYLLERLTPWEIMTCF